MENSKNTNRPNHTARNVALSLFVAVCGSNLLCDLGDLLAKALGHHSHYFNTPLLILGIVGMFGFGISLFGRRSNYNNSRVGKIK